MSFWIVVTGLEIYDKTKEMEFKKHGFKSTRNKLAQNIAYGDCLIFYITGKKQFAGIVEVTSKVIYDDSRVWQSKKKPGEMYPFRVNTKPVITLEEGKWLNAETYHERLKWTKKWPRKNWTLAYQGSLREIPKSDYAILLADFKSTKKQK
jgi:predicted RNA-binding protein|tara:strand:- start:442 stop:891 length:450 start_codon:yes stop_codon:yes gene_type:complete